MTDTHTVGILGGGQLGRMLAVAAAELGVDACCLDAAGAASPAGQVLGPSKSYAGNPKDAADVAAFAKRALALTAEVEHISTEGMRAGGGPCRPSAAAMSNCQDKLAQKRLCDAAGLPLGKFTDAPDEAAAGRAAASELGGYPVMLKARRGAYDGRGNAALQSAADLPAAFAELSHGGKEGLYLEAWQPFVKELAVVVLRGDAADGTKETKTYPVVETVQRDSICHATLTPANVSAAVAAEARRVAALAVEALGGDYGVFGVELFLLADGTVLLNEVAPRPHNSGHYTIEACEVSQFHNHLRAACRLPLGSTALSCGAALMVNVLGDGDDAATRGALDAWLAVEGASPHWYGKAPAKKGRKMGHVTVVAPSLAALRKRVAAGPDPSLVDTLLGGAAAAPVVGIIMGSTSDLGTMKAAAEVLDALDVPYELTIVSAHRTPARLAEYAASAERRGLSVIVAGAGGAAHLPGMVAAQTALPVVGVPVKTSTLSGVDSLYSIVQMPKGIPVATVAIGNACNAGLLAARILGVADLGLRARLKAYAAAHEAEVLEKAEKVEALGWKGYLDATGGGSGVVDV